MRSLPVLLGLLLAAGPAHAARAVQVKDRPLAVGEHGRIHHALTMRVSLEMEVPEVGPMSLEMTVDQQQVVDFEVVEVGEHGRPRVLRATWETGAVESSFFGQAHHEALPMTGRTLLLRYDAAGELERIEEPAGREVGPQLLATVRDADPFSMIVEEPLLTAGRYEVGEAVGIDGGLGHLLMGGALKGSAVTAAPTRSAEGPAAAVDLSFLGTMPLDDVGGELGFTLAGPLLVLRKRAVPVSLELAGPVRMSGTVDEDEGLGAVPMEADGSFEVRWTLDLR